MADRWEYDSVLVMNSEMMDELKRLGEQGWELVSVEYEDIYIRLLLKRRAESDG